MSTRNLFAAAFTMLTMTLFGISDAYSHSRGVRYVGHPHGHPSIGIYWGFPWYTRPYYPYYPYTYPYYPPEIVTVPVEPPVYIERNAPPPAQQLPSGYWYYCADPEGYYPYIKECPGGWRQVEPAPPAQ